MFLALNGESSGPRPSNLDGFERSKPWVSQDAQVREAVDKAFRDWQRHFDAKYPAIGGDEFAAFWRCDTKPLGEGGGRKKRMGNTRGNVGK